MKAKKTILSRRVLVDAYYTKRLREACEKVVGLRARMSTQRLEYWHARAHDDAKREDAALDAMRRLEDEARWALEDVLGYAEPLVLPARFSWCAAALGASCAVTASRDEGARCAA